MSATCHFYRIGGWKPPYFLGPALVNAILYVWAKRSPYIRMDFMGLFPFQAVYLPWIILGLEYLLDNVRSPVILNISCSVKLMLT